jgi:tellurite resistance protein
MNLRATLEKILSLLVKQPNAEHQAKLKASAAKLLKAASDFQALVEFSVVENSFEYAALAGLLNDPTKKRTVNLAWANGHLKRLDLEEIKGKSLTAIGKSQFIVQVVTVNAASEIIKELSQTEENKLQDTFALLAKASPSQVEDELDKLKGVRLELFCRANSISVIKKKPTKAGKVSVDRDKTYSSVMHALTSFKERLKL